MKRYLFLFLVLLFFSCGGTQLAGTEIGNARVEVVGVSTGLSRLNARSQSSGISIDRATIVLDQLEFRTLEQCQSSSEGEIEFEGPYVVDLLTNASTPDLGTTQIPITSYCRIELRMAKLDPGEVPSGVDSNDPIVDHSLYVTGERGDFTPFIAKIEQDEEFRIENDSGFDLLQSESETLFLAFDLTDWFSQIDLDSADITSGTILIDKDHNSELYDQLKTNVQLSAHLFEDSNDNGELDNSEEGESLADGAD
jgi:hypothetical protein